MYLPSLLEKNALITHHSGKIVNAWPFAEQISKLKDVLIVDFDVAHDCPDTKKTDYLVIYNELYVSKMEENMVPPFTLRHHGNVVNGIPKIQLDVPLKLDHCLILDDKQKHIPLQLIGTMSYFKIYEPKIDEYEEAAPKNELINFNMDEAGWDPMNPHFALEGAKMSDFEGRLVEQLTLNLDLWDMDITNYVDYDIAKGKCNHG